MISIRTRNRKLSWGKKTQWTGKDTHKWPLIYRDKCFSNWFFMIDTIFECACVLKSTQDTQQFTATELIRFHFLFLSDHFCQWVNFVFTFILSFAREIFFRDDTTSFLRAYHYMDCRPVNVFVWKWNVNKLLHTFQSSFIQVWAHVSR